MFTLKPLERPATGAGAPAMGSRYAYLALVKDLVSFPDTDENNVVLQGQPVFKDGKGLIPVYITTGSREVSYETNGDQDARSFKLKFVGSHPGTEREALEFATNMLDEEFIIFIPGCQSSDPVKVLGRKCAPLVFKSSHKSGKDGSKFEFTFEQEVGGKNSYMLYFGPLNTLQVMHVQYEGDITQFEFLLFPVLLLPKESTADIRFNLSPDDIEVSQVTFIGQDKDSSKASKLKSFFDVKWAVFLKNDTEWLSLEGSSITLEVRKIPGLIVLIERWRT